MMTRTCALVALSSLLAVGGLASAEPDREQREFELKLLAHFRHVTDAYTTLEADRTPPTSKRWVGALDTALADGQDLVLHKPLRVQLTKARKEAWRAWELALEDTVTEYDRLRLWKGKEEGPIRLRDRARGLLLGYRNACRRARGVLSTPELEQALPPPTPPKPAPPPLDKQALEAPFTRGSSLLVCKRAAKYVRQQHRGEAPEDAKRVDTARAPDILLVHGSFDRPELVLDAMRIRHTVVRPYQSRDIRFRDAKLVIWACGEALPQRTRKPILRRLREYVQRGGHLYTTDWGVDNVLREAAPGVLTTNGAKAPLPELVVGPVIVADAAKHPLLRSVLLPDIKTKWFLENSAFDIRRGTRGQSKLVVLLEAEEMAKHFQRSPILAATFPVGKGRVLHVLPQTLQESGNLAGAIAVQRLLLNFISEALRKPQ